MAQFTPEEMNQLRTQMYGGFVQKSVPRFEMKGAGSGRKSVQTGYDQVTNYDAYNTGLLGRARDAAGIKKVNKDDEIRRIYDFIGGYQAPAPAAPAAPAAAPAPLMPQISPEAKQYRADTQKMYDDAAKLQKFNADQAAAVKAREIASANQARSAQTANLQIQPASSTPKTAGTQIFKKRRIASNRKQQLTSGINLGTSSLLNI